MPQSSPGGPADRSCVALCRDVTTAALGIMAGMTNHEQIDRFAELLTDLKIQLAREVAAQVLLQIKQSGLVTIPTPIQPDYAKSSRGSATRFLRLPEVQRRTGLSRNGIYRRMRDGAFPKSIAIDGRITGWVDAEVEQWIQDTIASSKGKASTHSA